MSRLKSCDKRMKRSQADGVHLLHAGQHSPCGLSVSSAYKTFEQAKFTLDLRLHAFHFTSSVSHHFPQVRDLPCRTSVGFLFKALGMTVKPRPVPRTLPNSCSAWDRAISMKLFHASSRVIPRKYMLWLEHSGNGLVWLFGAITLWLIPSITPQQRCAITNFLLAFIVDLILVGSLKSLVRRPRPIYNSSGDFILVVSVDQYSFPSGHASRCSLPPSCQLTKVVK